MQRPAGARPPSAPLVGTPRASATAGATGAPTEERDPATTRAPDPSRDAFLDVVRAVAITRVVVVHLLAPLAIGQWYGWLFPGMPIVFFVAGALAFASLDPHRPGRSDPGTFRRNRLVRLLVPYWTFAAVVVTCTLVAAVAWPSARTAVQWHTLGSVVVPAAIPTWSAAARGFTGHLWFASNIIVLVVAAPLLVRAHRHRRWWPLLIAAGYVAVVLATNRLGVPLPREARSLALYSVMFCAGFFYTDREWRAPRWLGAAVLAVGLPLAAWATVALDGTPNTNPLLGLPVAACWLTVALLARRPIRRAGERHRRLVGWVSARTLTIYLWGWPTSRLAIVVADAVAPRHSASWTVVFVVGALALLAGAVAVFFPVERWAASTARALSAGGAVRRT